MVGGLISRAGKAAYTRTMYWVVRPTLGSVPRRLYGNDAGWLNNWNARRGLRRLRAAAGTSVGAQADPRVSQLSREGYLRIFPAWAAPSPGSAPYLAPTWDRALLDAIRTRAAQLLEDPRESVPLARGGYSVGLMRPIAQIPELARLVTDDVVRLVGAYYGTACRVARVSLWRNKHVPAYDGSREFYSDFWHCDEYLTWRLKMFVNLTDVTRETGALRVHSLGTTRRIMRDGYITRYWIMGRAKGLLEDTARIVYTEGPVGSGIFANTQLCLHAASIPKEGTYRDIVEISFEPSPVPIEPEWAAQMRA